MIDFHVKTSKELSPVVMCRLAILHEDIARVIYVEHERDHGLQSLLPNPKSDHALVSLRISLSVPKLVLPWSWLCLLSIKKICGKPILHELHPKFNTNGYKGVIEVIGVGMQWLPVRAAETVSKEKKAARHLMAEMCKIF